MKDRWGAKTMAVATRLAMEPSRRWTVRSLAAAACASPALVSRVLTSLGEAVVGDRTQGRIARLAPTEALLMRLAEQWPSPATFLAGPVPQLDDLSFGGGPAHVQRGLPAMSVPVIYVKDEVTALELQGWFGGHAVSEPVATWAVCILPVALPPGPLPDPLLAVELATTPRGREVLAQHHERLLGGWLRAASGGPVQDTPVADGRLAELLAEHQLRLHRDVELVGERVTMSRSTLEALLRPAVRSS